MTERAPMSTQPKSDFLPVVDGGPTYSEWLRGVEATGNNADGEAVAPEVSDNQSHLTLVPPYESPNTPSSPAESAQSPDGAGSLFAAGPDGKVGLAVATDYNSAVTPELVPYVVPVPYGLVPKSQAPAQNYPSQPSRAAAPNRVAAAAPKQPESSPGGAASANGSVVEIGRAVNEAFGKKLEGKGKLTAEQYGKACYAVIGATVKAGRWVGEKIKSLTNHGRESLTEAKTAAQERKAARQLARENRRMQRQDEAKRLEEEAQYLKQKRDNHKEARRAAKAEIAEQERRAGLAAKQMEIAQKLLAESQAAKEAARQQMERRKEYDQYLLVIAKQNLSSLAGNVTEQFAKSGITLDDAIGVAANYASGSLPPESKIARALQNNPKLAEKLDELHNMNGRVADVRNRAVAVQQNYDKQAARVAELSTKVSQYEKTWIDANQILHRVTKDEVDAAYDAAEAGEELLVTNFKRVGRAALNAVLNLPGAIKRSLSGEDLTVSTKPSRLEPTPATEATQQAA